MNLPKHMPALDGLRGVAILMVLLTHVSGGWPGALWIYPGDYEHATSFALPPWLTVITSEAAHGVSLFFVVSAFTLTIRTVRGDGDLRSYALRRLARVGPGYWAAGLAYTLAAGLAPRLWAPGGISPVDLIIAAVFGSAWSGGASLAVVPGGWSVGCEVAFYVALPVLIRVINGRIWRSVALIGLATAIAHIHARYAIVDGVNSFVVHVNPIEKAPIFLCGVTAALVAIRLDLPHLPGVSVALVATAIVALPFLSLPVFAPVVSVAVALAAANPPALLSCRFMRRIGEVSYSMYLVHFAVLAGSMRLATWLVPALDVRTMSLHFAFTLATSFALASITYRCIEMPAIRWAASRVGQRSVTLSRCI